MIDELDELVGDVALQEKALRLRSLDPEVSAEAARDAKAKADDATFQTDRLKALKPRLQARFDEIKERDPCRAADTNRQRLAEETALLTARLADRWPALTGELIELMEAAEANAEEVDIYNRGQPQHARILCAEFAARGVPGHSWPNQGGWVERLFTMRILGFTSPRDQWPIDKVAAANRASAVVQNAQLLAMQARNSPEGIAEARRREEARWARYELIQKPYSGTMIAGITHRDGNSGVGNHPAFYWMHVGQVAAAREKGLVVTPAPLKKSSPEPADDYLNSIGQGRVESSSQQVRVQS